MKKSDKFFSFEIGLLMISIGILGVLVLLQASCNDDKDFRAPFVGKIVNLYHTEPSDSDEEPSDSDEDTTYYCELHDIGTNKNWYICITTATYFGFLKDNLSRDIVQFNLNETDLSDIDRFDNGNIDSIRKAISLNYTLSQPRVKLKHPL